MRRLERPVKSNITRHAWHDSPPRKTLRARCCRRSACSRVSAGTLQLPENGWYMHQAVTLLALGYQFLWKYTRARRHCSATTVTRRRSERKRKRDGARTQTDACASCSAAHAREMHACMYILMYIFNIHFPRQTHLLLAQYPSDFSLSRTLPYTPTSY